MYAMSISALLYDNAKYHPSPFPSPTSYGSYACLGHWVRTVMALISLRIREVILKNHMQAFRHRMRVNETAVVARIFHYVAKRTNLP